MKKQYIKPTIRIPEFEQEFILASLSGTDSKSFNYKGTGPSIGRYGGGYIDNLGYQEEDENNWGLGYGVVSDDGTGWDF